MKPIKQIGLVCYGNIARSQVLGIYLIKFLNEAGINTIRVYSVGTAPYETYPTTPQLIKEVEEKLKERGVNIKPRRNHWTEESKKQLEFSDIILVADENRKKDVIDRLGDRIPRNNIYTFYQFIGEGEKDFEDSYDYEKGRQDPVKFSKIFDELERIAKKAADKIKQMQNHN